jgi:recombination protein RecT
MSTVTQAVEKKQTGPVSIMWTRRAHFGAVLPKHIDVESFLGTAAGALYADPKLMEAAAASPDSLITALMRCAAKGHQPGTEEFYLVPRRIKGVPTVQGIEGYRGIVERMYRSGGVASVVVREVCAMDRFQYLEGQDPKPIHQIGGDGPTGADFFGAGGSRDRGEMVGVYAYATLMTGAVSRVVLLNREDVMAAKAASDGSDSKYSPWNRLDGGPNRPEFTGRSMWWKTAARRLEPWVPTSSEYRSEQLRAAVKADNLRREEQATVSTEEPVDAEIVETPVAGGETWPAVAQPGGES